MSAPKRRPALTKAPTGAHPIAPRPNAAEPEASTAPKPTVMVSARIDVDLRHAVRIYSAEQGVSVQEIMAEALGEYLARNRR